MGVGRHKFVGIISIQELEKRLRSRGTEIEEKIKRRLEVAVNELAESTTLGFDRIIVNDELESGFQQLKTQVLDWYPILKHH